ncbi:MAG: MarR family transcriptional regulator [Acidimicrobiia bacterium]
MNGTAELLRELRLRGMVANTDALTADALIADGLAVRRGKFLTLTPHGRDVHDREARLPDGSEEEREARHAYDTFLPMNQELLQICTDWQVRPGGVTNDHRDVKYEWDVIDRCNALDERAGPVVRHLGKAVERFSVYRPRLRDALRKVEDGDHEWLVSPRCDSYHTVWMQLHEDLLLALGRSRNAEATI